MELRIDQLNLQLPDGFEHRAAAIAQDIASELARLPISASLQVDSLSIEPQQIHAHYSDQQIASQIAQAIHGQLQGREG